MVLVKEEENYLNNVMEILKELSIDFKNKNLKIKVI